MSTKLLSNDPLELAYDRGKRLGLHRIEADDYSLEELNFLRAIDHYKQRFHRPHPTWLEVLAVVKSLGYKKDDHENHL